MTATTKFDLNVPSTRIRLLLLVLLGFVLGGSAIAQDPVPLINQPLAPSAVAPGSAAFTLTVNGSGFVSGATVLWNGFARTTTFVSSSQLTASILQSDVAVAGTAEVSVKNPGSAAISNVVFFSTIKAVSTVSLTRNDIACGANPQAVAVADFNGDGIQDLAVLNGNGNSVSIFTGNGSGTFNTPTTSYPVAPGFPDAVVVGDFNNDGKLDLAVLVQHAGEVSILLGNGDGTFQSHLDFVTGNNPLALAVGDFNGDGILDLATANNFDNTVSILLGNGDGTFQNHVDYATGSGPNALTVGDFNGDGILDLAVVNNNDNTVSILLGHGDGTFPAQSPAYSTAAVPTAIVAGNFNKDGILDLAVATASGKVSVLLGSGGGLFASHVDYSVGANSQSVIAADLHADGNVDLAVANYNDSTVSILQGNGDGTFKSQSVYPTNSGPGWLAAGDFNGNGKLDLATADSNANTISLLMQGSIVVSPTFLSCGNQQAGIPTSCKSVTVKNSGTAALTITGVSTIGTNASEFSVTNSCGSTLAAGSSCTFSITFTPNSMGVGKTAQTIVAFSNGTSVGFGMSGSAIISITMGPRNITYRPQLLNTSSKPVLITFTNDSGVTITDISLLINGINPTSYSQTNTCVPSLAGFQSCTISVTFTPQQVGGLTAAVNIFGTFTAGSGQQASLLAGTGTAVSVTPGSLTFAAQTVGTSSSPQNVSVHNVGSTALPISSVTLQGVDPKDFSIPLNPCNGSIAAGGKCVIPVTFTPTATGTRTATLNIGDPDPTGPQVVSLTGTGQ